MASLFRGFLWKKSEKRDSGLGFGVPITQQRSGPDENGVPFSHLDRLDSDRFRNLSFTKMMKNNRFVKGFFTNHLENLES